MNLAELGRVLLLDAGYNTRVVMIGVLLLGAAAGAVGAFALLRRRALMTDAVGHAALPGLAVAFLVLVALGGNGRWLPGLMVGAALSATLGLLTIDALVRRTRLHEDAAIGLVLSVFFGLGVVLLTLIQGLPSGRRAGLDTFLLGSAAGMLRAEAELIAVLSAGIALAVFLGRRRLALVSFDATYAQVRGISARATDLLLATILLAVVVVSLKVVGVVLSVALAIIPAVTARFWTDRVQAMAPMSAALGAGGAYVGAALSAAHPGLPTGALIVLTQFGVLLLSMLAAPQRGLIAGLLRHARFRVLVHRRQGLLSLARGEPIYDGMTLRVLRRQGLIRRDGVATRRGRLAARQAVADERLWEVFQQRAPGPAAALMSERATPLRHLLPADTVAELARHLPPPAQPR